MLETELAMRDLLGAVEGGGTKFLCAAGTGPFAVVAESRVLTRGPDATMSAVIDFFRPYRGRLRAVGVCSFGPLELDAAAGDGYGSVLTSPKPGWSHVPLYATLVQALQVPVSIDTDVNGAALAEQRWGHGQGEDPLVYVTIGTGIGVGVVIAGRALHGLLHPELGHLHLPRAAGDVFEGVCPFHGDCLEGLASATALRVRTGSEPHALHDDHPVWELEAHYLAGLVHTLVLAYSPRRIVLGGGVMRRAVLWPKLRVALSGLLATYIPRVELTTGLPQYCVPSAWPDRAGLYGGFVLAERGLSASR